MDVKVSALVDICSERGMLLAKAGTVGWAVSGLKPNRRHHYGLVPVRWVGKERLFWTSKDKLWVKRKLDKCITPPPCAEPRLTLPTTTDSSDFDFGRNLKMFRRAKGLSQEELATKMAKAGAGRISQTSISNWERRADCPSGDFLRAAGAVLEVPVFSFFIQMDCMKAEDCLEYVQQLKEVLCGGRKSIPRKSVV